MKINTYVVNLKTSNERKKYMQNILSGYPELDVHFIEAVDGRILTEEERNKLFDMESCVKRFGKKLNPGEVGCTLSHYKCYKDIQKSEHDFVLILEDDITIIRNIDGLFTKKINDFMSTPEPRILFLSGDYWYWKRKEISSVFSAVGSYAYLINKAAVSLILKKVTVPFYVADDWDLYRSFGVKLFAVYPYMIDANIEDIPSDINQSYWGNNKKLMSYANVVNSYFRGFIKHMLVLVGHFESKKRR